ncbi:MAG: hypothetical protein V1870_04405 [Candidatus Aenigmatarchaeota archaeon]
MTNAPRQDIRSLEDYRLTGFHCSQYSLHLLNETGNTNPLCNYEQCKGHLEACTNLADPTTKTEIINQIAVIGAYLGALRLHWHSKDDSENVTITPKPRNGGGLDFYLKGTNEMVAWSSEDGQRITYTSYEYDKRFRPFFEERQAVQEVVPPLFGRYSVLGGTSIAGDKESIWIQTDPPVTRE